jgi:hypothetical protein
MYTKNKFPVLEQQFEWYDHSLIVNDGLVDSCSFIAGIDMQTGEIEVGPVFEFMAYKVQVFIIYKLITLQTENKNGKNESCSDNRLTGDVIVMKMSERFPHVDPDYFFRIALVFMIRSYTQFAACFVQSF